MALKHPTGAVGSDPKPATMIGNCQILHEGLYH